MVGGEVEATIIVTGGEGNRIEVNSDTKQTINEIENSTVDLISAQIGVSPDTRPRA